MCSYANIVICLPPLASPEDDTAAGQSINIRSESSLVSVAAQAGLQIVHHDQQDVWFVW